MQHFIPIPSKDLIRQIPSLSERLTHYRVSEGYFDDLSTRILSQMPLDKPVTGDQYGDTPSTRWHSRLWVRLRPWVAVTAALIAVVALWSVWRGDVQKPLRSNNGIANSVYDLSVTPLTDAEYTDYLYETCVDILLGDYAIGETVEALSEYEI